MDIQALNAVRGAVEGVMVEGGQGIKLVLTALLARGHVLIEDVPGVGKTTLVRALGAALSCSFRRMQFTPDVLPSDVTGFNVFNPQSAGFDFHEGPVMANLFLADELNRATPRTQAGLLECMEERQVTVDGVTRRLPEPFMVLATQNPVETEGTFPLPEAQLDRFMLRVELGYPSREGETELLRRLRETEMERGLRPVATSAAVVDWQAAARAVHLSDVVAGYIVDVCRGTRTQEGVRLGASPRAARDLMRATQALALVNGRDYVIPDDVKELAVPVLAHRLLTHGARAAVGGAAAVVEQVLAVTPVPSEEA